MRQAARILRERRPLGRLCRAPGTARGTCAPAQTLLDRDTRKSVVRRTSRAMRDGRPRCICDRAREPDRILGWSRARGAALSGRVRLALHDDIEPALPRSQFHRPSFRAGRCRALRTCRPHVGAGAREASTPRRPVRTASRCDDSGTRIPLHGCVGLDTAGTQRRAKEPRSDVARGVLCLVRRVLAAHAIRRSIRSAPYAPSCVPGGRARWNRLRADRARRRDSGVPSLGSAPPALGKPRVAHPWYTGVPEFRVLAMGRLRHSVVVRPCACGARCRTWPIV
jgi:hypothetical protein